MVHHAVGAPVVLGTQAAPLRTDAGFQIPSSPVRELIVQDSWLSINASHGSFRVTEGGPWPDRTDDHVKKVGVLPAIQGIA
jgi:hypothetical protein